MLLTSLPSLALFPSLDGPFPAHSYPSSETAKESSLRQASDAFVSAALVSGYCNDLLFIPPGKSGSGTVSHSDLSVSA